MISIFTLMLGYAGVMVMIMLVCNLRYGQAAGVVSVLVFSLYGILMQPDTIQLLLRLPDEAYYIANVTIGWLSPLNHATFHMHNFGYDKLPRLWQSYTIFITLTVILYFAAVRVDKIQHGFDRGGLSRVVPADKARDHAFFDIKRNILQLKGRVVLT